MRMPRLQSRMDPALVERATLLARNNQDPQLAIQLLKLYLDSPNKWPIRLPSRSTRN